MISIEEFIKPLCLSWCWDNHNWNRLVRSLLSFLFLWLSHEDGQKHQDWFGVYRCIRGCDRFDLSLHQSKEFKNRGFPTLLFVYIWFCQWLQFHCHGHCSRVSLHCILQYLLQCLYSGVEPSFCDCYKAGVLSLRITLSLSIWLSKLLEFICRTKLFDFLPVILLTAYRLFPLDFVEHCSQVLGSMANEK